MHRRHVSRPARRTRAHFAREVHARFGRVTLLEQLRLRVRIVEPAPPRMPVSRDVDDDVVLATAVAAGAALIVSGDQDLLVIGRYNAIDIVTPREFLSRLSY
ncbi:MAG: putative toxin-antitoxin system toxin component, PIN family [Vicinamibacterales bacterium]